MGGVPAGAGSLVGQRLGKYQLLALLALGGTAEIYLARIDGTAGFEKYVVVKCLHDHLADDQEFVRMFLDEARLGATLDHSNIVQTLELGEQNGRYFMAMEFLAGLSLALVARKAVERAPGGRIPVHLVLGLAVQACGGLHYAHERRTGGGALNVVHRDISPQNLVVTFEGVVKLVDFGIAKAEHRETHTRSGTIKGKFAYMSPEQCLAQDVDRRTDVFALGVIVHELVTGRRLFKRGSTYDTYQAILECRVPQPSAVNHELDPGLDAVIMTALAKDREDRYPTAEAFGEALIRYLHQRGKHSGPGEVSRFFDQYFAQEIDEHGARMRELLEGREHATSLLTWDADADSGVASKMPDDEPSMVVLDTGDVLLEESQVSAVSDLSDLGHEAPTSPKRAHVDEDEPAEKTRIEENPLARVLELERQREEAKAGGGGRGAIETRAERAATVPARPGARAAGAAAAGPGPAAVPHVAPQGKRRHGSSSGPPMGGAGGPGAGGARGAHETPRSKAPTSPMPFAAPPSAEPPAMGPGPLPGLPPGPLGAPLGPPPGPPGAPLGPPPGPLAPLGPPPGPQGAPLAPPPSGPGVGAGPASPAAGIETLTDSGAAARRGYAAAPNARTMFDGVAGERPAFGVSPDKVSTVIHDEGGPAVLPDGSLTPPSMQSLVPPPSANPAGAVVNVELPLPAHLIGLPPVDQVFSTSELAMLEDGRRRRIPPWLLIVLFVGAMAIALGVTIALAKALR